MLPKLLRTGLEPVDPEGHGHCSGTWCAPILCSHIYLRANDLKKRMSAWWSEELERDVVRIAERHT